MKMLSPLEKHQQHKSLQFLRMVLLKTVLISGVVLILLAGRLSAQVLYGGLVGNVTDPSGAVVPNAEVRARNLDTGDVLQTTTGNTGSFAIGNVQPGRFEVTITKQGFGTFKAPSVSVEMDTQVRVDAALQVGNTNATITVSTQDAQLQTDSADVHDAIGSKQFQDLPQPTRTYQGLVGLVTGVAPPSPDFAGGGGHEQSGTFLCHRSKWHQPKWNGCPHRRCQRCKSLGAVLLHCGAFH